MFSTSELERLSRYRYESSEVTALERFMYRYVWRKLGDRLPLWLAPNVITISGMLVMLLCACLGLWHSPSLHEICPPWVYLVMSMGVLFFQTSDVLDGQQARRTGSSSALGQLFDHGCDALTTVAVLLSTLVCLRTGTSFLTFVLLMGSQLAFFLAQLEEHWTGVLTTSTAGLGVTELQFLAALIPMLTFFVTPAIWDRVVPGCVFLNYRHVIVICMLLINLLTVLGSLWRIVRANRGLPLPALIQVRPFVMLIIAASSLVGTHGALWASAVSIPAIYMSLAMIVANVSGQRFPNFFPVQWPLLLLAASRYLGLQDGACVDCWLRYVLYVECVALSFFVIRVVLAIRKHLGIRVFHIKKNL